MPGPGDRRADHHVVPDPPGQPDGVVTRQKLRWAGDSDLWLLGVAGERPSAMVAPALAMFDLPPGRVRAELAPLWERLRAGTLSLSELPGQRR